MSVEAAVSQHKTHQETGLRIESSSEVQFDTFVPVVLAHLRELADNIVRLPKRTSYEIKNRHKKPQTFEFNTMLLERRLREFRKHATSPAEAMQQLLELVREDYISWMREHLLHEDVGEFSLYLQPGADGSLGLVTSVYEHHPLHSMTRDVIEMFDGMGRSTTRLEADHVSTARWMKWAATANQGDQVISVSPISTKGDLYKYYSFIFLRRLEILPDGRRVIRTTQVRSWQSHDHLVEVLRALGCPVPPVPPGAHVNEFTLASGLFPVANTVHAEQIQSVMDRFPKRREIPPELQQVQIQHPAAFQRAVDDATAFVMRVVQEQYAPLMSAVQLDERELLRANRITEEAIVQVSSRFLRKYLDDEKAGTVVSAAAPVAPNQDLYGVFMRYVRHKFYGEQLDKQQATALLGDLGGVLGSLGKMPSLLHCFGGTIGNITVRAGGLQSPDLFRGLRPEMLGGHIIGTHTEECPFCCAKRMVYDLANGDVQCPGCGMKKFNLPVNGEAPRKQTLPHRAPSQSSSSSKPSTTIQRTPRPAPQASPQEVGDFVASLFSLHSA